MKTTVKWFVLVVMGLVAAVVGVWLSQAIADDQAINVRILQLQQEVQTASVQIAQLKSGLANVQVAFSPAFVKQLEKMSGQLERMDEALNGFSDEFRLLKQQVDLLLKSLKEGQ